MVSSIGQPTGADVAGRACVFGDSSAHSIGIKLSITSSASAATALQPARKTLPTSAAALPDLGCPEQLGSDSEAALTTQAPSQSLQDSRASPARTPNFTFGSLPSSGFPIRPAGFSAPPSPASPAQLGDASPGRPPGLASPRSIRLKGSVRLVGDSILPLPPAWGESAALASGNAGGAQGEHVAREPSLQHLLQEVQHAEAQPPAHYPQRPTQEPPLAAASRQSQVVELLAAPQLVAAVERCGPGMEHSLPSPRFGTPQEQEDCASPSGVHAEESHPGMHSHFPGRQLQQLRRAGALTGAERPHPAVNSVGKSNPEGVHPHSRNPPQLASRAARRSSPQTRREEGKGGAGLVALEGPRLVSVAVSQGAMDAAAAAAAGPLASPSPRKRARKSQPARAACDDAEYGLAPSLQDLTTTWQRSQGDVS